MTGEATDLAALKRLAEEATPGPWDTDENSVWGACDPDDTTSRGMGINILQCRASVPRWAKVPLDYEQSERNAAFIAAANPATILSLATLIEAQAAEIEGLRKAVEEAVTAAMWSEKALERYDNALGLDVDEAALVALSKCKDFVERYDTHRTTQEGPKP